MKQAPYGSWRSPLTTEQAVSASVRLSETRIDSSGIYWIEGRPEEGGRCVLVRRDADGRCTEPLPSSFSVRSRVNEYGGGAYAIRDGRLCFINDRDQSLYVLDPGGPRRLTEPDGRRYADLAFDAQRPRVLCVCEDHGVSGEPATMLVGVDLRDGHAQTLARGADFYAMPALSQDGARIAWIEWRHPNMPWDSTELKVGRVGEHGALLDAHCITGPGESVQQPTWHTDGMLYFISDRNGWWNLYRWNGAQTERVTREAAELAGAPWVSGSVSYALSGRELLCVVTRHGRKELARGRLDDGALESLSLPFTDIEGLRSGRDRAVFIGASPRRARAVVELDRDGHTARELRASSSLILDDDDISTPEALSFATGAGEQAHAFCYAPRNRAFTASPAERPPVIVKCHGGPTSGASAAFDPRVQYWTTRGFTLLDVNYRGSTGYGRAYRERLYGEWGIVDVEDCVRAVEHVAAEGRADGNRALITGSSAGGYTVLCALVGYDRFRAGASHYGIGDLALLVSDTHKFESRYTQRLIGDDPEIWRERSPIHHVGRIDCPVLFLQGLEDRVVPPQQSQHMVAALRARGVPVAYLEFAGESHGFRRAETLRRALEAELDFHTRVLRLAPAEPLVPVVIEPPLP